MGDGGEDFISVNLGLESTTGIQWLTDKKTTMLQQAGGSRVVSQHGADLRFHKDERFRFRVYFNLTGNQPLYESPVLDDITFFVAVHRVLRWQTVK